MIGQMIVDTLQHDAPDTAELAILPECRIIDHEIYRTSPDNGEKTRITNAPFHRGGGVLACLRSSNM